CRSADFSSFISSRRAGRCWWCASWARRSGRGRWR
ncbi:MAG: hypothetical protein AVDCRST_MAG04-2760, partial [uncultured Acetobacteraceae bacterium]